MNILSSGRHVLLEPEDEGNTTLYKHQELPMPQRHISEDLKLQ
jgi:hypothetical protein